MHLTCGGSCRSRAERNRLRQPEALHSVKDLLSMRRMSLSTHMALLCLSVDLSSPAQDETGFGATVFRSRFPQGEGGGGGGKQQGARGG